MVPALYRITAALLVAHEVDAGYWREWEVLRIPGGAALFVALHVPLALAVVWGAEQVARGGGAGRVMAAAVGGAGVVTVAVHGVLLLAGRTEFSTWPSLALLALVAVTAPALLAATARARAQAGGGAP